MRQIKRIFTDQVFMKSYKPRTHQLKNKQAPGNYNVFSDCRKNIRAYLSHPFNPCSKIFLDIFMVGYLYGCINTQFCYNGVLFDGWPNVFDD
jgi:hypothetical protein